VLKGGGKFKLGRDERDDTFPEILAGLHDDGRDELAGWIAGFNPDRA
jgi:hypothetical protein